jgi:hypothetical protein
MKPGARLYAVQINHGQSEIWLAAEDEVLTERRRLATNEVINVTRRLCTEETFATFNAEYHKGIDQVASLIAPNIDEIAVELRVKPLVG